MILLDANAAVPLSLSAPPRDGERPAGCLSNAAPEPSPSATTTPPDASEARLERWFRAHFSKLWRFVARLGVPSGIIDDVVQDAFIAANRRHADIIDGREWPFLVGTALRLAPYLFYGAPGRFDAGVDLATADATFLPYPEQRSASVIAVGDIDGDGDDELAARFFHQWVGHALRSVDLVDIHSLAFISGSRTRLSGGLAAPAPSSPFERGIFGGIAMNSTLSLGDIDGDGADDLLTTTEDYSYDPVDGHERHFTFRQDHIHFGVQGRNSSEPLR